MLVRVVFTLSVYKGALIFSKEIYLRKRLQFFKRFEKIKNIYIFVINALVHDMLINELPRKINENTEKNHHCSSK